MRVTALIGTRTRAALNAAKQVLQVSNHVAFSVV